MAAQQEAVAVAAATDGYAGALIDQNLGEPPDESSANDPRRLVLNVATAGDVVALESTVREVCGGSLCVSTARYSEAELGAAQEHLNAGGEYTSSGISVRDNAVAVTAWVATESMQARLDERFGPGMVGLSGLLQPVEDAAD